MMVFFERPLTHCFALGLNLAWKETRYCPQPVVLSKRVSSFCTEATLIQSFVVFHSQTLRLKLISLIV